MHRNEYAKCQLIYSICESFTFTRIGHSSTERSTYPNLYKKEKKKEKKKKTAAVYEKYTDSHTRKTQLGDCVVS